jgi:hypothetical protein
LLHSSRSIAREEGQVGLTSLFAFCCQKARLDAVAEDVTEQKMF